MLPFCLYSIGNYLVFIVCYISEYIGMRACPEEIKDMQFAIVLFGVQKQPVRTDMALAEPTEITCQFVVVVLGCKRNVTGKTEHYLVQLILRQVSLAGKFEVFLVLRRKDNRSHCTAFKYSSNE